MAIYRERNREQYTIIANATIRDLRLSNKDLGALVRMLALPDDWNFTMEGLIVGKVMPDGKDSISRSLKKLEIYKYLNRIPQRGKNGVFMGYEWEVFESSAIIADYQSTEGLKTEKAEAGKPETEKPKTGKLSQSSIDVSITYLSNKECVGTLTKQEYDELVVQFGSSLVDEIITRIRTKHYRGCMTRATIEKWCEERRQCQSTTRASAFNSYPQRDYDFEAFEKEILGE